MAFDLASREPCADGNCVGIIGKDGHCGVCGAAAPGGRPAAAAAAGASVADSDTDDADDADADDTASADAADVGGEFDPGRKLCSDGNCIGVIGPDGRCKVCGLELGASPPP